MSLPQGQEPPGLLDGPRREGANTEQANRLGPQTECVSRMKSTVRQKQRRPGNRDGGKVGSGGGDE